MLDVATHQKKTQHRDRGIPVIRIFLKTVKPINVGRCRSVRVPSQTGRSRSTGGMEGAPCEGRSGAGIGEQCPARTWFLGDMAAGKVRMVKAHRRAASLTATWGRFPIGGCVDLGIHRVFWKRRRRLRVFSVRPRINTNRQSTLSFVTSVLCHNMGKPVLV